MSIDNKYRVHEVAKDFKRNTKEITDILTKYASTPKNHMQVLSDGELSIIFDYLTQHNQVDSIETIFADVYHEPKPAAPKAEAPKAPAGGQAKPGQQARPGQGGGKDAFHFHVRFLLCGWMGWMDLPEGRSKVSPADSSAGAGG